MRCSRRSGRGDAFFFPPAALTLRRLHRWLVQLQSKPSPLHRRPIANASPYIALPFTSFPEPVGQNKRHVYLPPLGCTAKPTYVLRSLLQPQSFIRASYAFQIKHIWGSASLRRRILRPFRAIFVGIQALCAGGKNKNNNQRKPSSTGTEKQVLTLSEIKALILLIN